MEKSPQDNIITRLELENSELKKRLFSARQRIMELEEDLI